MRVIFLKDVTNVANEGDVKDVKDGYARNFLLKNKYAVEATENNLKMLQKKLKEIEEKESRRIEEAKEIVNKLKKVTIKFTKKAGENGKLYGAITTTDLADELKKTGIIIEKKNIDLKDPLKTLGTFEIKVNMYKTVKGSFSVVISQES